jgi:hypothetical protein
LTAGSELDTDYPLTEPINESVRTTFVYGVGAERLRRLPTGATDQNCLIGFAPFTRGQTNFSLQTLAADETNDELRGTRARD